MRTGIRVDTETRLYVAAMKKISKDALPGAVADTLNGAAAAAVTGAKAQVKKSLIVRTPYTLNSIKQDRTARGSSIKGMYARIGSISPYLPIQDEGGTVKAKKEKLAIPTMRARGGNKKRRIQRRYYLGQYSDKKKYFIGVPRGGSRPVGVWERYQHNKKLRMIRDLGESKVRLKGTRWFSMPIRQYGSQHYLTAQFIRNAKRRIRGI